MKVFATLWKDEAGFVVSSELVLIATTLVIGMLVGLTTVRDQVVQELADVAGAMGDVNQSYSFTAVTGHTSSTAGSDYTDRQDECDAAEDVLGAGDECVDISGDAASNESGV